MKTKARNGTAPVASVEEVCRATESDITKLLEERGLMLVPQLGVLRNGLVAVTAIVVAPR